MKKIGDMIVPSSPNSQLANEILADSDVLEFLKVNKISAEDIKHSYLDLREYIGNKNKYILKWNGNVELVLHTHNPAKNMGIEYIGEPMFKNDIQLANVTANTLSKTESLKKARKIYDENKGFYLFGENGIGKTFFVVALANHHYKQTGEKTMFIAFSDFIKVMHQFRDNPERTFERVKLSKRLIIDDLGTEKVSDFTRDDILGPLISFRLERGLKTVITSNYSLNELEVLYTTKPIESKKVRSIIKKIEGLSEPIEIVGNDMRNS